MYSAGSTQFTIGSITISRYKKLERQTQTYTYLGKRVNVKLWGIRTYSTTLVHTKFKLQFTCDNFQI